MQRRCSAVCWFQKVGLLRAAPWPRAITTDARSPFWSAQEDPFLLLESAQKAVEGILRGDAGRPLRRTWIEHPYGEEEICLLEEEIEIRHAEEEAAWEHAALMAEAGRAGMGY